MQCHPFIDAASLDALFLAGVAICVTYVSSIVHAFSNPDTRALMCVCVCIVGTSGQVEKRLYITLQSGIVHLQQHHPTLLHPHPVSLPSSLQSLPHPLSLRYLVQKKKDK